MIKIQFVRMELAKVFTSLLVALACARFIIIKKVRY
jgi:hypothetical protein